MSKIEVDTIAPQSGTTVTLGESGDTVNIPSGVTLTNSGTATGFGISWQSDIKTSAFTAVAGEGYWINTTSAAVTVTLPASASVGDEIEFTDYARTWGTNNLTLNQNSLNYQGNSSPNPVYDVDGQHIRVVYSGATQGWIPTVDDDVTFETPQTYSADFLVIAGGGGAGTGVNSEGQRTGGGGGAGGYRNSYNNESSGGGGSSETSLTFNPGTVYTITVGAGGAGAAGAVDSGSGTAGNDSSIAGSDITNITSAGGGQGSERTVPGGAGGSGGGGGSGASAPNGAGGSGTANQGFDGGTSVGIGPNLSGGGGGAGEAGNTDGSSDGGDGLSSSITGSAVSRGGGGAGGNSGTGGDGGGGNAGGSDNVAGSSGTANTGGGGGANGDKTQVPGVTAGSGGSGVVILRVATSNYSGTTTGSPTVTTDGSDTIMKFTGDGSYTA